MSAIARFEYDPDEHYAAVRAATSATMYRWFVLGVAIGLPAVMIGMILRSSYQHGGSMMNTALSSLPWVLLSAFYLAMIPMLQRRQARRLPQQEPWVRGVQQRSADAEGLHVRGNGLSLDLPWADIHRVVETPEFFLFFYNRRCAHFIPKRALAVGGVEDVRSLVRTHAGTRAKSSNSMNAT